MTREEKRRLDEFIAARDDGEHECERRLARVASRLREPTEHESLALDDPAFKSLALMLLEDTRQVMKRGTLTPIEAAKMTPCNDALQTIIEWLHHNID